MVTRGRICNLGLKNLFEIAVRALEAPGLYQVQEHNPLVYCYIQTFIPSQVLIVKCLTTESQRHSYLCCSIGGETNTIYYNYGVSLYFFLHPATFLTHFRLRSISH